MSSILDGLGLAPQFAPWQTGPGFMPMTTTIEVELENGETVSGRADFAKGNPIRPMSDRELGDKFRECPSWGESPKSSSKEPWS